MSENEPVTYMGKPIDEMTREELIAALKDAGKRYMDTLETHTHQWETLELLREARNAT